MSFFKLFLIYYLQKEINMIYYKRSNSFHSYETLLRFVEKSLLLKKLLKEGLFIFYFFLFFFIELRNVITALINLNISETNLIILTNIASSSSWRSTFFINKKYKSIKCFLLSHIPFKWDKEEEYTSPCSIYNTVYEETKSLHIHI